MPDPLTDSSNPARGPKASPPRLADRAYADIIELVRAENLKMGDRLPSEARLAERFGISRAILREALVRLAADGIIEARRGAGSFLKRRPSDLLHSHMPLDAISQVLGSYEVRFVLESEAARLAAMRRTQAQMDTIQRCLDRLSQALLASGPAHEEDLALHRAIFAATGNALFTTTLDAMQGEIERIMRAGVDISRSRPPEAIEAMLAEHRVIVDAIRMQDADGAALAMRWHLAQGRKRLML